MIDDLIDRMQAVLGPLQAADDPRRHFHATCLRTTIAARGQLRRGGFLDAGWAERRDVAFADLYLDALQAAMAGRRPSRPWQIAFSAPRELPALRHVLLGMNAHVNFDLPQAIVAVITDGEFRSRPDPPRDRDCLGRRRCPSNRLITQRRQQAIRLGVYRIRPEVVPLGDSSAGQGMFAGGL